MAELVQRNIELGLADLEPMEANGLCSQQEVTQILQKRRSYEYKLLRKPPRKADYLSYIQYEVCLYMLFSKRKSLHTDRSEANPFGRFVYSANKIHILFTRVLRRFKSDLRLWLQYADFCKRVRHYSRLSKCITKAVRIHPRCSGLWTLGAWTALTFDSDTNTARVLLLRGLRVLPDDQHLWLELFRLEILYIYKIQKRQSMLQLQFFEERMDCSSNDDEMPYKAAHLVYTQAIEKIPDDLDFRNQFIQLLRDYKDTDSLQDLIYLGLKEDFADDPTLCVLLSEQLVFRYMDTQCVEWGVALRACKSDVEQIFEEAIEKYPTCEEIWEAYFRVKLEIFSSFVSGMEKLRLFKEFTDRLKEAGVVNDDIRTLCVTFLKKEGYNMKLAEDIKNKILSLQLISSGEGNFDVYSTLIGSVTLDDNFSLILSEENVNLFFHNLYKISFRCQYQGIGDLLLKLLQWSVVNESIQKFRSKYEKLLTQSDKKWPLELYLFCSEMEKNCEVINESQLDLIFEKMIISHGSDNVKVWVEYIRVKKLVKDYRGAGECHQRAMISLNPNLVEEFLKENTLSSLS